MVDSRSKLDKIRLLLRRRLHDLHDPHEKSGTPDARGIQEVIGLVDEIADSIDSQNETGRQTEPALRDQLEQALNSSLKSEKIFRTIYENSPIGIAHLDRNLRFISANPAVQQLVGYSEAELRQMTVFDLSHPDDMPASREQYILNFACNGGSHAFEKRYYHKSGRVVWGQIWSRVVQLEADGEPSFIGMIRDITDWRESELRNSLLLESMSDGMVMVDVNGSIRSFNQAACEIFGLSPEDLRERTVFDPRWQTVREDGTPFPNDELPSVVSRRTGRKVAGVVLGIIVDAGEKSERRWLRMNATPFPMQRDAGATGDVECVVTTFSNISDLVRTQKEAQTQNQLLTSVLDNIPVLVFAKDASNDFSFTLLNRYGEDLIGLEESEMVGRTVHDVFPKEQADFFEKKDRDVFALGTKITIEREQMLSTKGQRWLKTFKVPTYRSNGDPDLLIGISVDLTDEIEAEERRKRLLDENRAILKSARFAIITTDLNGVITTFNDEAERILGYRADEIIGQCTLAAFHDRIEVDMVAAELSAEFSQRVPLGFETIAFRAARGEADERQWSYIRNDGRRVPVRLSVTALRTTDDRIYGFMGIAKDLTGELALQRTLEAEKSKSLHSAKMASLGEMSAGIAHEINNPLAIIAGNLRILKEIRRDDVKFENRTAAMVKAAARIEKIVKGLQKFSHSSEKRDHRLEDLTDIINESVSMAEVRAKRYSTPIGVEVNGKPRIVCDAVEIEQVLINLINNGIDAVKGFEEKWVKVRAFTENAQVVVQVIDAGLGISLETERMIFQPFFTTKPIGEGTGLGLSIARGIIEQHRASIALSRSAANTCFELRFPIPEVLISGN